MDARTERESHGIFLQRAKVPEGERSNQETCEVNVASVSRVREATIFSHAEAEGVRGCSAPAHSMRRVHRKKGGSKTDRGGGLVPLRGRCGDTSSTLCESPRESRRTKGETRGDLRQVDFGASGGGSP